MNFEKLDERNFRSDIHRKNKLLLRPTKYNCSENEILFEFTEEQILYLGVTQIIVEWQNQDDHFYELTFSSPCLDSSLDKDQVR